MYKLFSVTGKVVLITGSSRGLGFKLAQGFAKAGAIVVVNGQSVAGVERAVDLLHSEGGQAEGFPFDVSDQHQVSQAITRIEKEVGPIDVLVNNAGIHRRAPLEEMTKDQFLQVIDVNLVSVFSVSQLVASQMIKRKQGRIINITSLNAEGARPTIANYCAAKGGLKMLTKSMATEYAKYNIQTNAIGPGYFKTDMTKKLRDDPEFDSWVKQEVPLARWGDPQELVGVAIFLASQAASYINGQTIYVDGGWQASL